MSFGAPAAGVNASTTPSAPSFSFAPQNTTSVDTGFNASNATAPASSSWGAGLTGTIAPAPASAPASSPFGSTPGPAASTTNAPPSSSAPSAVAAPAPASNPFSAIVAPAATGGKAGFSFGPAAPPSASDPAKSSAPSNPPTAGFGFAPATTASTAAPGVAATTLSSPSPSFAMPIAASSISFAAAPDAGAPTNPPPNPPPTTTANTTTATSGAPTAGGVGSSAAPPAPTPAPAASPNASGADAANLTGKTLSKVLGAFDKRFYNDQKDFAELAKHVVLRDRHLLERKLDLISISNAIKGALSGVNATKSVLRESAEKQKAMDRLLQGLEEAVDPVFQSVAAASAPFAAGDSSPSGGLRSADSTRYVAFQHVIDIYDEMMGLQSRLDVAVRQHREDFEEARGKGEVDRVMGLVAGQLSALESCSELATALEKDLDKLLGTTYRA